MLLLLEYSLPMTQRLLCSPSTGTLHRQLILLLECLRTCHMANT